MDLLLCNYSTTVANIKRIKNAHRLHVWVLRLTQVYTDLLGHNLSYNIKPKIWDLFLFKKKYIFSFLSLRSKQLIGWTGERCIKHTYWTIKSGAVYYIYNTCWKIWADIFFTRSIKIVRITVGSKSIVWALAINVGQPYFPFWIVNIIIFYFWVLLALF